jgi:hypothetical protein
MLHDCLAEGFYQPSSLVSSAVPISGKAVNRAWAIQPRFSRPGCPVLGQRTQDQQLMRSSLSFLWILNVVGFQTLKFQLQVFYCGFVDNVITITQDLHRYRTGENLCMAFVTTHCIIILWPGDFSQRWGSRIIAVEDSPCILRELFCETSSLQSSMHPQRSIDVMQTTIFCPDSRLRDHAQKR